MNVREQTKLPTAMNWVALLQVMLFIRLVKNQACTQKSRQIFILMDLKRPGFVSWGQKLAVQLKRAEKVIFASDPWQRERNYEIKDWKMVLQNTVQLLADLEDVGGLMVC